MTHLGASWAERSVRNGRKGEEHVDERALRELALDLLGDAAHDKAMWMEGTPKKHHQGYHRMVVDDSQMSGAATHSYGSPIQSHEGSGRTSPVRNFMSSPVASRPQSAEPSSRRPTSAQRRGSGSDSRPMSATRRGIGVAPSPVLGGQHQNHLHLHGPSDSSPSGRVVIEHGSRIIPLPKPGGRTPEQHSQNRAQGRRRRNRPVSAPPTPLKLTFRGGGGGGGAVGGGQHSIFEGVEDLSPAHDKMIRSLELVHPDRDTLRSSKAKTIKWYPCRKVEGRRRRVKQVTPGPGHYESTNWIPNPINFPAGPFTRVLAYTEPRLRPTQKEKELSLVPSPQDYHVSRAAGSESSTMRAFSKKKSSPAAFFGSGERVEIVFNKSDMNTCFY